MSVSRRFGLVAIALFAVGMAGEAVGQGLGNFFAPLFAPRTFQPPPMRRLPPARPPAAAARPAVVAKTADAARVLVVGDFLAGELADGLVDAFAAEGKFTVIDRSDAGSGLARNERLDWAKTLPQLIRTHTPSYIVVMVGANDRQAIGDGAKRLAFRSDGWEAPYAERVEGLAAALQAAGKPAFWVGLPPVRTAAGQADMAYLNGVTKPKVEQVGIRFVDIWDAFVDKDGRFVANGPDNEGQIRPLRMADGTSFTRAGQRLMAIPVEKAIRGLAPVSEPVVAVVAPAGRLVSGPNGQKWTVGAAMSLVDPPGTAALAGDGPVPAAGPASLQHRVIVQGLGSPTVAGRADDFVWPPN
ncbi:MAG: DUF459 domain-containing protein [Bauldia sp.]